MNSLARQAKFFCESCGAEVPHNSKVCNNCGRFFASVRCPNCGKTGTSSSFINGCPQCGYAVSGSKGKNYKYKNKKSKKGFSLFSNNSNSLREKPPSGPTITSIFSFSFIGDSEKYSFIDVL